MYFFQVHWRRFGPGRLRGPSPASRGRRSSYAAGRGTGLRIFQPSAAPRISPQPAGPVLRVRGRPECRECCAHHAAAPNSGKAGQCAAGEEKIIVLGGLDGRARMFFRKNRSVMAIMYLVFNALHGFGK